MVIIENLLIKLKISLQNLKLIAKATVPTNMRLYIKPVNIETHDFETPRMILKRSDRFSWVRCRGFFAIQRFAICDHPLAITP